MAESNVLREYLVKLGFKVDETTERRMRDSVEKIGERLMDLAKAAAVVATAVSVAVAKTAQDFDNLFFASMRIKSSVSNIKGFEYALKQMGGTGESARAALEGLARFIRNSPGAEGWLGGLGVATRDSAGKLRDTVDIFADLSDVLSSMDSSQANSVAQFMGLDDNTLQALRNGGLREYMADYQKTLKALGIDQEKAAESAYKFQRALTEVQTILGLLVQKYTTGLLSAPLGRIWDPEIQALKTLVGWFQKVGEWISKIGNALSGGKFGDWLGMVGAKVAATFGSKEALSALESNGDISKAGRPAAAPGASAAQADPKARAMAFFRSMGWSQSQAAGLVANLWHESGLNPSAVGDGTKAYGIAQWHPDRQAAFKAWSGKDIRQSTLQEQMAFVHYELTQGAEQRAGALLRATQNASDAGSVVSRYYERPLAAEAAAAQRGATAVQLAATTTINVTGASDPMGTAQQVANLQGRVAQDQLRNFQTVMR